MSKIFLFVILLCLFFTAGFQGARWLESRRLWAEKKETPTAASKFLPTDYPIENHFFAIVIIAKNNGAYLEKTLQSAIEQKYQNFKIVYVDDASDDGSFELARDLIKEHPLQSKISLLRNETAIGFLASLKQAAELCQDEEIMAVLQGEDRLSHEWVLQRLNQYYAHPDLWLTYGSALSLPFYHSIPDAPSRTLDLKTFYASLFKRMSEADVHESAFMASLIEMAEGHTALIPDILYLSQNRNRGKIK